MICELKRSRAARMKNDPKTTDAPLSMIMPKKEPFSNFNSAPAAGPPHSDLRRIGRIPRSERQRATVNNFGYSREGDYGIHHTHPGTDFPFLGYLSDARYNEGIERAREETENDGVEHNLRLRERKCPHQHREEARKEGRRDEKVEPPEDIRKVGWHKTPEDPGSIQDCQRRERELCRSRVRGRIRNDVEIRDEESWNQIREDSADFWEQHSPSETNAPPTMRSMNVTS